ncbi:MULTISPECIES: ISAzo13 family transposase [Protofrankia]|uniref:ISAzo13 family transposase n=1 Tax=Protofrankia symbiont of Coriaria myrtifolia TaxID=1306540 RepID=UPI0010415559
MFEKILPHLDEGQQRLLAGAVAEMPGNGGITAIAKASGISRTTVQRGALDIRSGMAPSHRVRRDGGGRKPASVAQPGLLEALDALVEPESRGDPMCPLRWTTKSTRKLSEELARQGFQASHTVLRHLLPEMGYSVQAPAKTVEGASHPDRDDQFRYIAGQVAEFQTAGQPVISVDTKKKELVGNYDNGGREWQPTGRLVHVKDHDFPDPDIPKAVPYGIYDLTQDSGWVTVGTSADTAEFALATISRWWDKVGSQAYPHARQLLITADAGGSNSCRSRLRKTELAAFAARTGIEVTVCHFPPGTSKWNKIEHRLFSHISMNWRGRPLESHEVVVNLIGSTTTRTGLQVHAELDEKTDEKGIKISDDEMAIIDRTEHLFHGEWNYTIRPSKSD